MRHGFFKNQEAMKGGEACDIHRAMKYTPVDPRIVLQSIVLNIRVIEYRQCIYIALR